ncbi:MAG: lysylphosphatidylglycerol synthase transmembrane domain-containing protein [Candidatus Rokuibacteriota bacterium]
MAGVAISVALFWYLLSTVDLRELGRELARTQWGWALLSAALGPAGLWARGRRWGYLFPPGERPPGILPGMMIGYMANNVLPLRAGEVVRIYVVARRLRAASGATASTSFWLVAATLAVERVLDSLALLLILGALVLVIAVPEIFQWAAGTLLLFDVVAIALLAAVTQHPDAARRRMLRWTARWPRLARITTGAFDVGLRGLEGVRTRAHLVPMMGWTVVLWLCPAVSAWAMLRAVHLDLPFVAGWTVLAFVGLGIAVPSAPGYVGVWHAAAVLAVTIYGVPQSTAVAYALLYHAGQFVPITLLGWLFLVREHMTLGEAARAAEGTAA